MKHVVRSAEETYLLGKEFASTLVGGEVVLLNGDLGAGKTTFTKGLADGLGIKETVTSPTFTLLNVYEGRLKLYHFDTYRLSTGGDVEMGFDEYYGREDIVCVVEWSVAIDYYNAKVIRIDFEYDGSDGRIITVNE